MIPGYFVGPNIAIRLVLLFGLTFVLTVLPSVAIAESNDAAEGKRSLGSYGETDQAKDVNVPAEPAPSASSGNESGSPIFPTVWCANITDSDTQKICWEAYREGLDYYERGLKHRTKVFEWQHVSTIVIFFVVLFLVGIGVYFAWVQFKSGDGSQPNNEIEVSLTSVKVSSPILGVIILVLSLAFFYLYLVYVYPVTEIF